MNMILDSVRAKKCAAEFPDDSPDVGEEALFECSLDELEAILRREDDVNLQRGMRMLHGMRPMRKARADDIAVDRRAPEAAQPRNRVRLRPVLPCGGSWNACRAADGQFTDPFLTVSAPSR